MFDLAYIRIWVTVCCCCCCCEGRVLEVNTVRLLVFQDAFPLICGVIVNRQLLLEEEDVDADSKLLLNDEDGVGCWPLDEGIFDEL